MSQNNPLKPSGDAVRLIKCRSCSHIWINRTKDRYVTCPQCNLNNTVKQPEVGVKVVSEADF